MDKAKSFAEKLGITFKSNEVYESYSIGSNTVSPLDMAGGYSAFGNNGLYTKPHFVQKVVLADGAVVNFAEKSKRVMQDYTAYMVTDMLRTVVNVGTGTTANVPDWMLPGKQVQPILMKKHELNMDTQAQLQMIAGLQGIHLNTPWLSGRVTLKTDRVTI